MTSNGLPFGTAPPPNASRYASPNLSFQVVPLLIDGISYDSTSKQVFKAISCNDDGIYLGTDHGEIIVLRKPTLDEEAKVSRTSIRLRRKIRSGDSPVDQLAYLRSPTLSYLIVLCAKTITVHRSSDLELLMTVPIPSPTCFAVNDGAPFPGLAVADASTLYLYNLQFGFDVCKPYLLPETPMGMAWMKDFVCVSFRDEYSLVSEVNGTVHELSSTDGAIPLSRPLPMEEILVITKSGALITQPQGWKVSAFKLSSPTKSLAFSFPYIFALSSKTSSSHEGTIEVRSVLDVTYHEILRLPTNLLSMAMMHSNTGSNNPHGSNKIPSSSSHSGPHNFILADDQLNVYLMETNHLFLIVPNNNASTSHSTLRPSAVARHFSSASMPSSPSSTPVPVNSPARTETSSTPPGLVSTPKSMVTPIKGKNPTHPESQRSQQTPSKSNDPPHSTPIKASRPSAGLFSFTTTLSPQQTASNGTQTPSGTANPSSPRAGSSVSYHIPPPPPNDKNSFIRYIRAVLKQEGNPYRQLLINYANQIVSEFPNIQSSKVEDVKKTVATYLRRFFRTFALEFKQFQTKTFRDLLNVAVSIALHSHIYNPLFSMIQKHSEDQDKHYNAQLMSLHSRMFFPSQFEIRPKFWLNEQSVISEQEKSRMRMTLGTEEIAKLSSSTDSESTSRADPSSPAAGSFKSRNSIKPTDTSSSTTFSSASSADSPTADTEVSKFNSALRQNKSPPTTLGRPQPDSSSPAIQGASHLAGEASQSDSTQQAVATGQHQLTQPSQPVDHDMNADLDSLSGAERFSLGEARLYHLPQQKPGNDSILNSKFQLLDTVSVSHNSDHHLYFRFAKSGEEKELPPQDWSFTFKDEERSIYWSDSESSNWQLFYPKRQFYLEFTTRYRLYENQQQTHDGSQPKGSSGAIPRSDSLGASSMILAQSYSQPSFLVGSLAASSHMLSQSGGPNSSTGSHGTSISTPLEFGGSTAPSNPSNISPRASQGSDVSNGDQGGSQQSNPTSHARDRRPTDLRRIALEHSAQASVAAASSTASPSPSSSHDEDVNSDSPLASMAGTPSITPSSSAPPSPSLRAGSSNTYPYSAAVKTLRLVPKLRTPREKIETMARALSYVTAAVDEFWAPHGKKVIVGADDLVPIFSYVVALARVPNMYSEMSYTMEFSNESSLRGKYGYSIATLQICVEHVLQVSAQVEAENQVSMEQEANQNRNAIQRDFSDSSSSNGATSDQSPASSAKFSPKKPMSEELTDSAPNSPSAPGSHKSGGSDRPMSTRFKSGKTLASLMGKMETMSNLAGKLREAEDANLQSFDGPSPPPGNASHRASSRNPSSMTSPVLSPTTSRPSTPSPPPSTGATKDSSSSTPSVTVSSPVASSSNSPKGEKYPCSALEVSHPQIEGHAWMAKGCIMFEGGVKRTRRTIQLDVTTILAIKKSWGLFGGDGLDIYATKDKILFLRHLKENRDAFFADLQVELDAAGMKVPVN